MERHRAFAPFITLLAIATGLTLFATGWTLASPAVSFPQPFATEQVVHDFYAAINLGIRTGDTSILDTLVVEDGVFHGGLAELAPDRSGLTRYVQSLHATVPQIELDVVDIVAAGDKSLVDIAIVGMTDGDDFDGQVSINSLWGEMDALRIGDGKVVEYWSGANRMTLFEPLAHSPLIEMVADRTIALDRLTILPGESFVAEGTGESRLLYMEAGQVTISREYLAWASFVRSPEPDLTEKLLVPNDFLDVPPWSRTELRNDGQEPACLLVVSVGLSTRGTPRMDPAYSQGQSTTYQGQQLPSWWAGVQERSDGEPMVTSLVGNITVTLPADQWGLDISRTTLAPGAALSAIGGDGLRLLTVNKGSLEVSADVQDGDKVFHHLEIGEGTLLDQSMIAKLSNGEDEPAVITIVAIMPAEA